MRHSYKYWCIIFSICITPAFGQQLYRSYMFGHSLMDHRPPAIATPSDETTIAHWIKLLSDEANITYEATGQYGFLSQHANLPPISQWGYDIVPSPWDSDVEPFGDADFNNILLTAGNFMQWQPPQANYPGASVSPLSSTVTICDWVELNEPDADIYIYENWPDMGPYLNGGNFPPSPAQLQSYCNYTRGDFHQWWIAYQDSMLALRPDINIRMIPVGPIIADLLVDTLLTNIPILDLYEDDAPHGRPTIYFLAALVTYMGVLQQQAPPSYVVPSIVHQDVATNYQNVVNYIWNKLNEFNDINGQSRVFFTNTTFNDADNDGIEDSLDNCPNIANPNQEDYNGDGIGDTCQAPDMKILAEGLTYFTDAEGILLKGRDGNCYLVYINVDGQLTSQLRPCPQP